MTDPIPHLNAALEGRYRVEREIGEGGMATVYLAEDLKHHRKVAFKVLKPELAAVVGPDRFLAEIETTANLQHPHILPLYDSGRIEADGPAPEIVYFVMPYVEGESLRDRLDREKQLPVEEAVRIATNVAEALEYAHSRGVVHRDIKPGNILLQAGKPVISDFGIALAVGTAGGGRLTETGLSLGSPHYMSPEQATGDRTVGPAADIYALGCVLHEMLVGEPPYTGATAQAVLGKIVTEEPERVTDRRRSVPPNVDAAIRKALEKVPADRFRKAEDLARALSDPGFRHGDDAEFARTAGRRQWTPLASAAVAVAALLTFGLAWMLLRPEPAEPVIRLALEFEEGERPIGPMRFTADGRALIYWGPDESGDGTQLWIRDLSSLAASAIPGTEGADALFAPSPTGREVALSVDGALIVVPTGGGPGRTLIDQGVFGVSDWAPDGMLYLLPSGAEVIQRIPADGGVPENVTGVSEDEANVAFLRVLPGNRTGVFTVFRTEDATEAEVWSVDLESGERTFLTAGKNPQPTSTGQLLFGTRETGLLMAAPIDAGTGELTARPVPVTEGLGYSVEDRLLDYAISRDGALVYSQRSLSPSYSASREIELIWVTRSGRAEPLEPGRTFDPGVGLGGSYGWRLSPDGSRVAVTRVVDGNSDIWIRRLPDGPFERLTFDEELEMSPEWSPDGRFVLYSRGPLATTLNPWRRRADGTGAAERLLEYDTLSLVQARWNRDDWMVFRSADTIPGGQDIYGLRSQIDTEADPLVESDFTERGPALSPDGRWLAYSSDETGQEEVYIRPFPDVDSARIPVSTDGGANPRWSHAGDELFFVDRNRRMTVARIQLAPELRVLEREVLFEIGPEYVGGDVGDGGDDFYDVAPDDQRFLMGRVTGYEEEESRRSHVLVLNFFEELRGARPE